MNLPLKSPTTISVVSQQHSSFPIHVVTYNALIPTNISKISLIPNQYIQSQSQMSPGIPSKSEFKCH